MRPQPGDYAPYYDRYISLIDEDDIVQVLENQIQSSIELLSSIGEKKANFAYAEGKWTIKQVLGHIIDTERIMTFRALSFARGEKQPIPGFEQDGYVNEANFNKRTLKDLINEFKAVRESNIILFKSFTEEMFNRRGIASGNEITVLALLFIIGGHEKHHLNVLMENYKV